MHFSGYDCIGNAVRYVSSIYEWNDWKEWNEWKRWRRSRVVFNLLLSSATRGSEHSSSDKPKSGPSNFRQKAASSRRTEQKASFPAETETGLFVRQFFQRDESSGFVNPVHDNSLSRCWILQQEGSLAGRKNCSQHWPSLIAVWSPISKPCSFPKKNENRPFQDDITLSKE